MLSHLSLRVCAIFAMLALATGAQAAPKTVYTTLVPPIVGEDGAETPGYAVEILAALAVEADMEFAIFRMPLARAIRQARAEPESLIFPLTRTPTREAWFGWPVMLFRTSTRFVSLKGAPVDPVRARALRIGVFRASSWDNWLTENGFTNLHRITETGAPIARLLTHGRIDAWYSETSVAAHTLQAEGFSDVRMSAPVQRFDTYLATNARAPFRDMEHLKTAFARLCESAAYRDIMARYGLGPDEYPPAGDREKIASPTADD